MAASTAMRHWSGASALIVVTIATGCGLAVTGQATEGAAAEDGSPVNASSSGRGTASSSSSGAGDPFDGGLTPSNDAIAPFDAYRPGSPDARSDAPPTADAGPADAPAADAASFCSKLTTCCTWLALYTDSGVATCESTASSNNASSCAYLLGVFQTAYLCLGL